MRLVWRLICLLTKHDYHADYSKFIVFNALLITLDKMDIKSARHIEDAWKLHKYDDIVCVDCGKKK